MMSSNCCHTPKFVQFTNDTKWKKLRNSPILEAEMGNVWDFCSKTTIQFNWIVVFEVQNLTRLHLLFSLCIHVISIHFGPMLVVCTRKHFSFCESWCDNYVQMQSQCAIFDHSNVIHPPIPSHKGAQGINWKERDVLDNVWLLSINIRGVL